LIALLGAACGPEPTPPSPDPPPPPGPALFTDATEATGLDFVHANGMSGEFYLAEIMGPGAALLDYDNDGDLDAYLVQGGPLGPDKTIADTDRLYRNDLVETGELTFVDVTAEAEIPAGGYGMGVAAGDFDGDGYVDLYVTNLGPNRLLRNDGDGTFSDVTATSGTGHDGWGTSAAFVDYDGDADLDLIVVNYVEFTFAANDPCYSPTSARDYCAPSAYDPSPDRLYRNDGGGRFEDVTAASQLARHYGAGLGVIATDIDGDGLVDLYVANDGHANQMWINRGDGTFSDESLLGGSALNAEGTAEASMGVDAADFDGDGDEDLFMTHIDEETNTLFVNDGSGRFTDGTLEAGLGVSSRQRTGFGTAFVDYDNDGWLDLIAINGAVKTLSALARLGDPFPLHQKNQLFHNGGAGRFEDVTAAAGPAFELSEVGRGAAFGDVDNDGDVDVLVANNHGPARLLVNEVGSANGWVGIRAMDADGQDLVGTRLILTLGDGTTLSRRVRTAASYCSANDPRVIFGLGNRESVRSLHALWPDGSEETWADIEPGAYMTIRKGSGTAPGS
jgi:hypothetical protein